MRPHPTLIPALLLLPLALLLLQGCERESFEARRSAEAVYAEPLAPRRAAETIPGLPEAFDQDAQYTRDLYVATSGDDARGDGGPNAPFATLSRAARDATPGTRIHLDEGVYPPMGTLPALQGLKAAPIAIIGQGNAIIDGSQTEEVIAGLHLSNPRYVVIEGLHIRNTYPHGISIDDGGDYSSPAGPIILRNLKIQDVGRGQNNDCLKLSGVDHFQILGSEFANCDQGEAIDMVGSHHGLISGNTFRQTPGTAVQTKGGSSDILIHGNRFVGVTARSVNLGGHTGTPYFRPLDANFEAARVRVLSNIFYRSGDAAIAFTGCIDCLAAHNTIIDPQGHVVRLLEEHPDLAIGRDGQFINNLIAFKVSETRGYITPGRNTRPETFTLGWNLWYARDRQRYMGPHHDRRLALEEGAIKGLDPKFLDPAAGDYRLAPDSPAIGRGKNSLGNAIPDYDGHVYGPSPAIGAYSQTRVSTQARTW